MNQPKAASHYRGLHAGNYNASKRNFPISLPCSRYLAFSYLPCQNIFASNYKSSVKTMAAGFCRLLETVGPEWLELCEHFKLLFRQQLLWQRFSLKSLKPREDIVCLYEIASRKTFGGKEEYTAVLSVLERLVLLHSVRVQQI